MLELDEKKKLLGWRLLELPKRVIMDTETRIQHDGTHPPLCHFTLLLPILFLLSSASPTPTR